MNSVKINFEDRRSTLQEGLEESNDPSDAKSSIQNFHELPPKRTIIPKSKGKSTD